MRDELIRRHGLTLSKPSDQSLHGAMDSDLGSRFRYPSACRRLRHRLPVHFDAPQKLALLVGKARQDAIEIEARDNRITVARADRGRSIVQRDVPNLPAVM